MSECSYIYDCEQKKEHKNEDGNGNGNNKMVVNRELDSDKVKLLKLTYFKVDPSRNGLLSLRGHKIFLNISYGHCDQFFTQARIGYGFEKTDQETVVSPLIIAAVGGVLFVMLTSVGLFIFCKHKKSTQKTMEDIDINPDYGYNEEGVEYHESAIKDTNVDYGDDDDELDNQETLPDNLI
eukprot:GFUD01100947.1.p1 GENE.GFUD01100947.1~~GFUD01100947.1.p1  ORF type:complete len:180 (+),score=46.49 GFUD01100947.1:3-542(+)